MAFVYQLLYWLQLVDEVELVGDFVALVLVREVAPVLVGLLVIGRSGAFTIAELNQMRRSGQIHILDVQGIDPFLYLVVPRVVATSIGVFVLTLAFLVVALAAGLTVANGLGDLRISILDFLAEILTAMGPRDYLRLVLKSVSIGFTIGVLSTMTGLSASDPGRGGDPGLLARGFVRAALAILVVSGILSVLL
jgi:phospholipid/cholesterol/gamma-HCH transport system permease protein